MVKYTKLFSEFQAFVASVAKEEINDYEKKLINLIIGHFDDIADKGTAQGARGKLLNQLIQTEGATLSANLTVPEQNRDQKVFPFHELSHIDIEHFRGFSQSETIPFDKKFTFIYGPNGSGKSSLCEALEYVMLGYINEAITRRIDVGQYIQNNFTARGSKPLLIAKNQNNESIKITPDPSLYSFCFIEKNRIANFGRISANTPNAKQQLLASLFGLSEFNDFVGNFTENIEKYIDIVGAKQRELDAKSQILKVHEENIKNSEDQLEQTNKIFRELVATMNPPLSPEKLDVYLHGSEDSESRISEITKLLQQNTTKLIKVPLSKEINCNIAEIRKMIEKYSQLLATQEKEYSRVSFRKLYAATIELESYSRDKCPVCETPIENAVRHPFENAKIQLDALSDIAELEKKIEDQQAVLRENVQVLQDCLNSRKTACETLSWDYPVTDKPDVGINVAKNKLEQLIDDFENIANDWTKQQNQQMRIDTKIEEHNQKTKKAIEKQPLEQEESLKQELIQLQIIAQKFTTLKTQIGNHRKNIGEWKKKIDAFNTENAELIKQASEEKAVVDENKKFYDAYTSFLERLTEYKDALPRKYLKDLSSLTCDIYNTINEGDKNYEKTSGIVLPLSSDDPISIYFSDKPATKFNALCVLSEGHLRCLGLAILLAKNIQANCPVIIFDDVVNAIDDDHKGGVRKVIFTHPKIAERQIILTTHGEQFVKDIENDIAYRDYSPQVRKLSLVLDNDERRIRVRHDSQRNYLYKAQKACNESEWSEALYNCRCCLECLSQKLWKRLGSKRFKTEFSVVIRAPNGIPDLMSVICSMNGFLKKVDTNGEYTSIISIYDYLLNLQSQHQVIWAYLNKGTHEEQGRAEFDGSLVKEIFDKLLKLDALVQGKKSA